MLPPELLLLGLGLWGFAPGPTGGAYSAPRDLLAGFGGVLGRGRREERGREGEGRGKEGKAKWKGKGQEGMRGEAGQPQIFRWIDAFAS